MAKPASKSVAVKKTGTAVARVDVRAVDAQLATRAAALAGQLGPQGGGPRIKMDNKQGVFVNGEGENLGSELQVVILDFSLSNKYYPGVYNPNDISPPVCAAIGDDVATMAPFEDAPDRQSDLCATCPQNQFGSSLTGAGKACKNARSLALLVADADGNFNDEKIYTFDVPPTGIKSFDGIARFIARTYQSMPLRCITTMTCEDRGTYSSVAFSNPESNAAYGEHSQLQDEAHDLVFRKIDFTPRENAAKKPAGRAPAKKAAAPVRVGQRR